MTSWVRDEDDAADHVSVAAGGRVSRPTLYLSNFASRRTAGRWGPGRVWTIMAAPRIWERGEGRVHDFTPPLRLLREVQSGVVTISFYAGELRRKWSQQEIAFAAGLDGVVDAPTSPFAERALFAERDGDVFPVSDGDTLCCACSVAEAVAGRCHRAWVAPYLARAGWRVVLDGRVVEDSEDVGCRVREEKQEAVDEGAPPA